MKTKFFDKTIKELNQAAAFIKEAGSESSSSLAQLFICCSRWQHD
ncbi:MAG: hypothetical protein JSC188_000236 [Candidatus Tokpelaia sp. JSC188]|nr:MAG: hypothetical protein JSC188_000236 [Candidatus Tokpelaia sp. JSC188]